jgi:TonB family protein
MTPMFALIVAVHVGAQASGQTAAPQLTRAPEVLEEAAPVYPEQARKERREGSVALAVTLDAEGNVQRVDVVESGGAEFDWAALGALTNFRFTPAEVDGKPAAVQISYRLGFTLPKRTDEPREQAPAPQERATFTLAARVRESGTVRPLSFAEVTITPMPPGSAPAIVVHTDVEGRFSRALPFGPYEIGVGVAGYQPFTSSQYFPAGVREELDIALVPVASNLFETVVEARRGEAPVSRVSLSRAEITGIPGTYGDALRVVESLPGVARAPLLGGAIMVRGGYPADTSILFEGVPIPVLYHFGGFTSVINGAFVEELTFMPGGFPVRYGNATAGIVDVRAHALTGDVPTAHFDVDFFDVGFFFGGPFHPIESLPELKIGFAARRSHAEIPGSIALEVAQAFTEIPFLPVPLYYDYQLKVQSDVTSSSRLALFLFGAEDSWAVLGEQPILGESEDGELVELDTILNTFLSNHFHRLLFSWELRPLAGVTSTFRPYVGVTKRGLLSEGVAVPLLTGGSLDTPVEEKNWGLRQEIAIRTAPWLRSMAGVEYTGALANRLVLPPDNGFEATTQQQPHNVISMLSSVAVYADTTLALGPVSVTPGVRAELASLSLEDTDSNDLYDGSSRSVVDQLTVDPRVQLRFQQTRDHAWKAAFGTFHQRPRAQSAAYDIDGTQLLQPGAFQVIGGFETRLTDAVTLDAQIYATKRTGLTRERLRFYDPENTSPLSQSPLPIPGEFDSFGSGETGGFELLLRHAPSKYFFGWISYTFSRTVVRLGDKREDEVPFPFDQTHNLVLVARVNLPWELTFGGRFAYVTGNPGPISDSVSTRHDLNNNEYQPVISALRSRRLPPFHRLDLRLDRKFVFSWCSLTPFAEVINVYNYPNPEVVFPGGDYRAREVRTLLPDPPILPMLGLELSL